MCGACERQYCYILFSVVCDKFENTNLTPDRAHSAPKQLTLLSDLYEVFSFVFFVFAINRPIYMDALIRNDGQLSVD